MATPTNHHKPHAADAVLGSGMAAAWGSVLQIGSLMWLHTTMNYQYRHGGSLLSVLRRLYREGGVPRLYLGFTPSLVHNGLSRFGDCAANDAALALFEAFPATASLPLAVQTCTGSLLAGCFRIGIMPVDTFKSMLQVEGRGGAATLRQKYHAAGVRVLYHGAIGSAAATAIGHYPWFLTYNTLDRELAVPAQLSHRILRNAVIGLSAGFVSDIVSNAFRVLKICRQTAPAVVSYAAVARSVVASDGVAGLLTRGLSTRILANGLSSVVFTVAWKLLQEDRSVFRSAPPTAT